MKWQSSFLLVKFSAQLNTEGQSVQFLFYFIFYNGGQLLPATRTNDFDSGGREGWVAKKLLTYASIVLRSEGKMFFGLSLLYIKRGFSPGRPWTVAHKTAPCAVYLRVKSSTIQHLLFSLSLNLTDFFCSYVPVPEVLPLQREENNCKCSFFHRIPCGGPRLAHGL